MELEVAELRIDPDFHQLIPPPSADERRALARKLLDEGFQARYGKIVVWGDTIVDGHNRYEICNGQNEDGLVITYETEQIEFAGRADAMQWIILNQASKRNLDPVSKAELAEKLIPIEAEAAKERQRASGGDRKSEEYQESVSPNLEQPIDNGEAGKAVEKAAKKVGAKKNTIYRVRRIKKANREDLLEQVKAETLSLNAAVRIAELYENLSREVAEAVEDLAHAGHRRVLNDNDELNRLAAIDGENSDLALEIVDVIAGDDKPDIRSVFAAEKYLKNKNKPQKRGDSASRKWSSAMHDIQMRLNSIRDMGGIEAMTASWDSKDKEVLCERLIAMSQSLVKFATSLKGGELGE